MEEEHGSFAQRYRRWIDGQAPDAQGEHELWLRISKALELCQGPPLRRPELSADVPAVWKK